MAVDLASIDLINSVPFNPSSEFRKKTDGKDKFKIISQDLEWKWQFGYGKKMGIGNKNYKIVNM